VRLYKYAKRGFAVGMPAFERARVDFAAVSRAASATPAPAGLMRLLTLEWLALSKVCVVL
jgi:hypothetical protein